MIYNTRWQYENYPPHLQGNSNYGVVASKPPRSSNLELYRILCMLLIVAIIMW